MRPLAIAAALLILIIASPAPITEAQTSPYDWCYTFNFATASHSAQWSTDIRHYAPSTSPGAGYGTYSGGAWQAAVATIGGEEAERLSLGTVFDTASTISAVSITIQTQSGWEEDFDFTTSSHGFIGGFGTSDTTGRAQWVSGSGFRRNSGDPTRFEIVTGGFIRGNISEVSAEFSRTVTLTASGSWQVHKILGNVSSRPQSIVIFSASQTVDDFTRSVSMNFNGNERFTTGGAPSSSFSTPTFPSDFYLQRLILSGTGLNPFSPVANPNRYFFTSAGGTDGTQKFLTATSDGTYNLTPDAGTSSEFSFSYYNTEFGDTRYRVTQIVISGMGDEPYSSIANACADDDTPRWFAPLAGIPERTLFLHDSGFAADPGLDLIERYTLAGVTLASQPVFAATDGYVLDVQTVAWANNAISFDTIAPCPFKFYIITMPDYLSTCTFFAPYAETGLPDLRVNVNTESALFSVSDFKYADTRIFNIVTVGTDDGYTIRYFVANARASYGDRITAGCKIGNTSDPSSYGFDLTIAIPEPSLALTLDPKIGIVAVQAEETGSPFDATAFYVQEPNPNAADCNVPAGFENCIAGGWQVNASTQKIWSAVGDISWGVDRATLAPGATLAITSEVDLSLDPVLWVYARGVGDDAYNVLLQFNTVDFANRGQTITRYLGTNLQQRSVAPSGGEGYEVATLKLVNNAEIPLQVSSFCITQNDEEGNPTPPPDDESDPIAATCTFKNSDFDTSQSWTYAGGASFNKGEVILTNGASVSQPVSVSGSNYLTMAVSLKYSGGYSLSSADPEDVVSIEFRHNGGAWVEADEIKISDFIAANNNVIIEYLYTATLSGSFEIRAVFSGLPSQIIGVALKSACLSESQYDEAGGNVFPLRCGAEFGVASGENLSTWIEWLWANQWQFYNCKLMQMLNTMYALMMDSFNTWGRMARYNMLLFRVTVQWMGTTLFPWLDGHFYNIARGTVTNVTTVTSCDNFFCFFESLISNVISPLIGLLQSLLDIIAGVFNFALGTLTQFVDLAFGLFGWLFGLIQNLGDLLGSVLGLWNDTEPADLPFIPSCSIDPKADMICIVFWMMENTIFSGAGSMLIPLWISFGTLMALLWAIKKLRNAITNAGAAL